MIAKMRTAELPVLRPTASTCTTHSSRSSVPIIAAMKGLTMGPGSDRSNDVGALVSSEERGQGGRWWSRRG